MVQFRFIRFECEKCKRVAGSIGLYNLSAMSTQGFDSKDPKNVQISKNNVALQIHEVKGSSINRKQFMPGTVMVPA